MQLFILIFLAMLFLVSGASWLAWRFMAERAKTEMVRQLSAPGTGQEKSEPAQGRYRVFLDKDPLKLSSGGPFLRRTMDNLTVKAAGAGLEWTGAGILTASTIGAVAGATLGWLFPFILFRELTSAALGLFGAWLPFLILGYNRNKRTSEFEEQLPESLDFIARAIRAGHAFSVSLELLANDAPEPTRAEFNRVFQEQNLGAPIETALKGLAQRLPMVDVRFFVSAVLLQREAGGNLSEILTNLAHTVRERFRLRGQIKAVTAHARLTALLLTLIPVITVVFLQVTSPGYMNDFVKDPLGRWMLLAAAVAQALGYYIMRKMANFKV